MQQLIDAVIGTLAAVVLVVSVKSLFRAGSAYFAVGALLSLLVVGMLSFETNLFGLGATMQLLLLAVALSGSAHVLLANRANWNRRVAPASMLPAAVSAFVFLTNSLANPNLPAVDLLGRAAPVVFWIILGALVSVASLPLQLVASLGGLMLSLSALASFAGSPWRACDQFKCGIFGGIFTGPFASENYLAQVAAIAIILSFATTDLISRCLVVTLAVVVLSAATSRTALLSLIVAVLVGLVLSKGAASVRARMVPWLIGFCAVASSSIVTTAQPSDYSNRGGIWVRALRAVEGSEWFGVGISRWAGYQAIGLLPPNNFPHNQLLLVFFSAGMLGVVLYLLMLWRVYRRVVQSDACGITGYCLLAYTLISGITEVMWNPGTVDGHSIAIFAAMLLYGSTCQRGLTTADAAGQRKRGGGLPLTLDRNG